MNTYNRRALEMDRRLKQVLLGFIDAVLVAFSIVISFTLQHQGALGLSITEFIYLFVPLAFLTLATFLQRGLYRAMTRYITGSALRAILPGVGVSTLALAAGFLLLDIPFSLAVLVLYGLILLFTVGASRLFLRGFLRMSSHRTRQPAVIYGAGTAGQQLVATLSQASEYNPVAFVDDDKRLHGRIMNGVAIHPSADLRALIDKWQVRDVLMAMPSISRSRRQKIVSRLEALGVEVKTIPSMTDLIRGTARVTDLISITPEDLLGRDPVPPQPELMQKTIKGKVVLVTGAGGSIGAELCRQIVAQGPKILILLDISEYALYAIKTEIKDSLNGRANPPLIVPILGSVQNPGRMRAILQRFNVQTLYHAAAYKHVVLVEENVVEGLLNNVFGTKVISDVAIQAGVENFILVSTDKTVRPANVMGASKRLAELICQAHAQQSNTTVFSMVRFGNVLGSSGSVIPRFREQIERGGPVTVTHPDMMRYFMTIPEAAQLVIQAGAMAKGGDVFVLDMGKPVKILELAKSMIRLHGLLPYVTDGAGQPISESGDIAIRITGQNKGEKMYEELMIGRVFNKTSHPRILTASEIALAPEALRSLLDSLWVACKEFDLTTIQSLLKSAPLEYSVSDDKIHDQKWSEATPGKERQTAIRAANG